MRAPRIDIIGAGPGGLYTAILARRHLLKAEVRVIERNARGATFGFGVVFSDQALDFLAVDDPETHRLLTPHLESWRNMKLNLPAGQVTLDGVGFSAIGRLQLLEILEARAADLSHRMPRHARDERLSLARPAILACALSMGRRCPTPTGLMPIWWWEPTA